MANYWDYSSPYHALLPNAQCPMPPINLMQSDRPQPNSYDVKVTLLLAGGHQYALWLKSDSAMLENLLKVVVARSQNQPANTLFQLPVNEGHTALCFPSEHLIGVL